MIKMPIKSKTVADKIAKYLYHKITLEQLVKWAETAMMEGEFDPKQMKKIRDVVSHIGLANGRAFGLTWDDCEKMLKSLGYSAHVDVVRA